MGAQAKSAINVHCSLLSLTAPMVSSPPYKLILEELPDHVPADLRLRRLRCRRVEQITADARSRRRPRSFTPPRPPRRSCRKNRNRLGPAASPSRPGGGGRRPAIRFSWPTACATRFWKLAPFPARRNPLVKTTLTLFALALLWGPLPRPPRPSLPLLFPSVRLSPPTRERLPLGKWPFFLQAGALAPST